jgi:DNA-binding LacI/PurR family transcriptional regulator
MRTSVAERHERILELLRGRGQMRVGDLARELAVSAVTARRDVELLERQGALQRRHGVAFALDAGAGRSRRSGEVRLSVREDARSGPAPLVGMVVPNATYYFADVIRGARAAVTEAGGRLVIGITNYDLAEEREQVRQLRGRGVHALLMTPAWPTGMAPEEEAERVATLRLPTVLVERRGRVGFAVEELDRVASAHDHGGYLAVRHLASIGRRRTALIARSSPTAAQIQAGFHAALSHLGIACSERLVVTSPADAPPSAVDRAMASVLDQVADGVDSALVHTDADAVYFAQLVRSRGLRIPEDIAIVAYDDEIAALADPPLTAIAPPKFAVGHAAARLALSRLAERRRSGPGIPLAPGHHLDLLPELRVRESCGGTLSRR